MTAAATTTIADSNPIDKSPFEEDLEDDGTVTVSDLISGTTVAENGSTMSSHIVTAPKGHLELAEDADRGRVES